MLVSELMTDSVISIAPDEPASLAARLLYRHNIGAIPVCSEDGRLKGIVTDRDIVLRCVAAENDPETTPVREIMSRGLVTVSPTDDVREAARQMSEAQVRRLPVVQSGKLVGDAVAGRHGKDTLVRYGGLQGTVRNFIEYP